MNLSTLSPGRRSGSCGRYPTVAVAGFSDTDPASRAPSSSPASIRSSVDFPAPLAPTSPITLAGDTTRSAPEKMTRSACPADSPWAVSTAFTRANLGHPGVPPGPVAGRREDPGLVLGSVGVGFGHPVVGGQGQLPAPPVVACLERVDDVLRVVAAADPVHAEKQ